MRAPTERSRSGEDNHWLAKALGLSMAALLSIREEVAGMAEQYASKHGGTSRREVSFAVSGRLIRRGALKAGGFGGLTASPSLLPGLGTLGSALVGAAADLVYLTKVQIDLCYGISAAYEVELDPEKLSAIALALLGFSGSAEVTKQIAATTLRTMIDRAAAGYLRKGLTRAAADLSEKLGPRLLGLTCRLIPFVGIPLNASANAASTIVIGRQARKYFSTLDNKPVSMS